MAEINKPDYTFLWSSGGAIVSPSNVKIQTGWTAEVPPFQWENWSQNRQDNAIVHLFQKGISEWDIASNYYFTTSGTRSYVQGSDGTIYVAVADSIGQNPTTDVSETYWKVAFADNSTSFTIASGDARYARRANNLSDLANTTTARTNLSVYSKADVEAFFPMGHFYGFTLSNNVTSPNTTIDVGAGQAKNSTNVYSIVLSGTLSGILQASGAWAAGNNRNKLDTGAKAINTWYHVFAIRKTSDGTGDILFSLSAGAPTMPLGYSGFRRISSIRTDASGSIIPFFNVGRRFTWLTPIMDLTASVATAALFTLSVPTGVPVMARFWVAVYGAGDSGVVYTSPSANSITYAGTTAAYSGGVGISTTSGDQSCSGAECIAENAQVRFHGYATARVLTYGWEEVA